MSCFVFLFYFFRCVAAAEIFALSVADDVPCVVFVCKLCEKIFVRLVSICFNCVLSGNIVIVMVRGNMRGGRGGVRVGMRGTFNKKASFSELLATGIFINNFD